MRQLLVEHTQWLGRFILATNVLDETALSNQQLLACYKEQSSSVERGFCFLKDHMFFADSLFLKSPVRIMAMIMVMRRVAQIFEGVDLLIIRSGKEIVRRQILNLSPIRLKILSFFESSIHYCYVLDP